MQAQHHKGDSKLQTLDAFKASCGALLVSLALASPVSANELTLEPSYHKVTRSDIMHMSIDKRPSVGVTNPSEAAEEAVDSVRMMIKRAGEGEEGSSKEVYSKKIRKDFLAEKEGASVSPAELGAGALKLIALWVPVLGLLSFLSKEETLDNSNMQGIAKVATVVAVPVNVLISGFLVPNADWHRIQDVLSLIVITGIAALPSFAMWAYTQGVYNWVQQEDEQD
mmetsp:Transcript_42395/g.133557  ORF Transcript_42395/g.133557 Transcript_42395/m.133557 type:complete len:224 (-) Transcript_42395:1091-1762(-)